MGRSAIASNRSTINAKQVLKIYPLLTSEDSISSGASGCTWRGVAQRVNYETPPPRQFGRVVGASFQLFCALAISGGTKSSREAVAKVTGA
jgi:hypothetical protein